MARNQLTDTKLRNLKPRDREYRAADGEGLYIQVSPKGSKLWRLRYFFQKKEKMLTLGRYPDVSLQAAREGRDEAKALLASGTDPSLNRKKIQAQAASQDSTLQKVASDWLDHNRGRWSARHAQTIESRLKKHVFPPLGSLPLPEITGPMVLQLCRNIENGQPSNMAQRIRQYLSAIFCYGIASGLTDDDPAAKIASVLRPVTRKSHHPAILEIDQLRQMFNCVEAYPGRPVVKLCFRMLAITAARSVEVRGMRWDELDLEAGLWRIPAARMKMNRDHIIPLSRQAIEIIETVRPFTSRSVLVFEGDSGKDKPLSDMTLSSRIKRSEFSGQHVPHGFRASFSSLMNERFPQHRAIIDQMLAHETRGSIEAAYNRAQHAETKKEISQSWADLLLAKAVSLPDLISGPRRFRYSRSNE